jgi:hypothetical protein
MSESSQLAVALVNLGTNFSAEQALRIARAEVKRDKEAQAFVDQQRAARDAARDADGLPGREQEPVGVLEVAQRAFAAEDAAEAERRRELLKRFNMEREGKGSYDSHGNWIHP